MNKTQKEIARIIKKNRWQRVWKDREKLGFANEMNTDIAKDLADYFEIEKQKLIDEEKGGK